MSELDKRLIVVYISLKDDKLHVNTYNYYGEKQMLLKDIYKFMKMLNDEDKGKCIYYNVENDKRLKNIYKIDGLKGCYEYLNHCANWLLKNTKINLFRHKLSDAIIKRCIDIFNENSEIKYDDIEDFTEDIDGKYISNEVDLIEFSTRMSFNSVKHENAEYKNCYMYDINRYYESLYTNGSTISIPICKPTIHKFTKDEFNNFIGGDKHIFRYGIYHIKLKQNPCISREFVFNNKKDNFYTHIDLKHYVELMKKYKEHDLSFELIEDGYPNVFIYEKTIKLSKAFGDYFKEIQPLLSYKKEFYKTLSSQLYGYMTEQVKIRFKDTVMKYPKYYFYRLKPFILSQARYKLYKDVIEKVGIDNIYKIVTDSVLVNKDIKDIIKIGTNSGQWKIVFENKDIEIQRCSLKVTK